MDQYNRLLVNLKILASVQPFQKLNTKSGEHLFIESGRFEFLYRWMREDSRSNTVKRLGEIVHDAETSLSKDNEDLEGHQERLRSQLVESKNGLLNLRQTYESDPTISAHFDVLLEKVALLIKEEDSDNDEV